MEAARRARGWCPGWGVGCLPPGGGRLLLPSRGKTVHDDVMGTGRSRVMASRHRILADIAVLAVLAATLAACSPSSSAPATPLATATAPASKLTAPPKTASQIAIAMGITKFTAYTAVTDPNNLLGRQGEYTSKVNWGSNLRNSIEVFANRADAEARLAYGKNFRCPFGDGYDYLKGTALLRLGCALTPEEAKADEELFTRAISNG